MIREGLKAAGGAVVFLGMLASVYALVIGAGVAIHG